MKLKELYTELSIDPFKLIESIVHAEGSSVILFKNRKSEILYVNEQFYHKHPQFKDCKESVALGNKTYGDARNRRLDRNARVHERKRTAADTAL